VASRGISLAAILAFSLMLTLIGIYLGRYGFTTRKELAAASGKPMSPSFSRFLISDGSLSLLDLLLVLLSYHLAYSIILGSLEDAVTWDRFIRFCRWLVSVKIVALLAVGVYRGCGKYISLDDVICLCQGRALGSWQA